MNILHTLRKRDIAIICGIAFFFVASMINVAHKHAGFSYDSGDTAVAQNALYNTLHGRYFFQPFLGTENNFREHISIIQVVFLPFYYIYSQTITLYGVLHVFYFCAAAALYIYTLRKTHSTLIGLVTVALILFNPLTAAQLIGPFHVAALALPLLLGTLIAYDGRNYKWFLIGCVALFTIPEFIAPTVIMIGVLAFIEKRSIRWIAPPMLSGAALLVLTKLYVTVGFGSVEKLIQALSPANWSSIDKLPQRIDFLADALRPLLWLLPLFSRYALLLIPSVLIIMIIAVYGRLTYGAHIVSVIPPILAIIALDIALRFPDRRKILIVATIAGLALSFPAYKSWMNVTPSTHTQDLMAALSYIVDDGSVTADVAVAPHLANRTYLYLGANKEYSDYIILKRSKHSKSIEQKLKEGKKLSFFDEVSLSEDYVTAYKSGRVLTRIKKQKLAELLNISKEELESKSEQELQEMLKMRYYSISSNKE